MLRKINNNPDTLKALQLRKHKGLATGLFLLMALVYFLCTVWLKTYSVNWIEYVKAFSEAAMVGALADWFAVTALFHHPMGIPIPHTNLIENSKKKIGDNLGGFVVSNFLNASTIRPYIEKLHISSFAADWLAKEKNINLLTAEVSWLFKDIIQKMDEQDVTAFLTQKSKDLLNDVKLNEALAGAIEIIMKRGDHERMLNYLMDKIRIYVLENEDLVKKRVKEESHFLIPGFVDNIIAAKLTQGVTKYLSEIESDPDHKIKQDFEQQLSIFAQKIRENPKWQQELRGLKDSLIEGNKIQEYASSVWKSLQASMLDDLSAEKSAMRLYFKKTIQEVSGKLLYDEPLRNKIDGWIRHTAYKYTLRHTEKMGELISNTVGNWEGKELSNKLELEVGKDLQFIRINGTLVGGLVGVLIHIITKLFT